jgi:hypothetical protein
MPGVMISAQELRDAVDALVADGATLREIELELIDAAPMGEDDRDALWLYAWGCLERHRPPLPA